MNQSNAARRYVPIAVIALVAAVAVSIIAGSSNPTLRLAAMIVGGAIALGLIIYKVRGIRGN